MTQGFIQFTKLDDTWCVKTLDPEKEFEAGKAVRFRKANGDPKTVCLGHTLKTEGGWTWWSITKRTPWAYWPKGVWEEDAQYQVADTQGFLQPPRRRLRSLAAEAFGIDHDELSGWADIDAGDQW